MWNKVQQYLIDFPPNLLGYIALAVVLVGLAVIHS